MALELNVRLRGSVDARDELGTIGFLSEGLSGGGCRWNGRVTRYERHEDSVEREAARGGLIETKKNESWTGTAEGGRKTGVGRRWFGG